MRCPSFRADIQIRTRQTPGGSRQSPTGRRERSRRAVSRQSFPTSAPRYPLPIPGKSRIGSERKIEHVRRTRRNLRLSLHLHLVSRVRSRFIYASVSSHPRVGSDSSRHRPAQLFIRLAVLAAPFPAVYRFGAESRAHLDNRNRISASTSIPTAISAFVSGSIRLKPAQPWLDPFWLGPAALSYRRKLELEEEEEKGIEKGKA